ncbi:unnamed protein product [Urochloa decumbens]|uniref:Uncharacterized protein n=1 Tax=Urochloa decumbens TaxID=240449 RepID=A0ABC9EM16_9POAL
MSSEAPRSSPAPAPVSLPDNDDIIWEILLRLPPLPSRSPAPPPYASAGAASSPTRDSSAASGRPPPEAPNACSPVFNPTLAGPDRIPPARFSFPHQTGEGSGVLRFDTDKRSLDVIQVPEDIHASNGSRVNLLRTVDGGLGIAVRSKQRIQLWGQAAISDHVVRWVLQKTVELDKFISLSPPMEAKLMILGFDEANNVIFLLTTIGIFTIQLESMKFTALSKDNCIRTYYPYTSFYTAGNSSSPLFTLQ